MMNTIKELKYFSLVLLLCSFLAAGTLSSCREQPKEEDTEQSEMQEEHHEAEEHPESEEHSEGEEHPEAEEHPNDSISG